MIGRDLRTRTLWLATSLLLTAACRSATPEPEVFSERSDFVVTAKLNQEITAAPGATIELQDANLRIRIGTLDDSRCPTKALIQCVWAGSVRVQLLVSTLNGSPTSATIFVETVSGKDSATILGKTIRLVRVTPEKETIDPIPTETYRVVLRVTTLP